MIVATVLALATSVLPRGIDRWSLGWPIIVVALLVPVILLRIADRRLRWGD